MKQIQVSGVRLIILQPDKVPEHAGNNLFEWIRELRRAGIPFMIDADKQINFSPDLESEVINLKFK